MGLVPKSIHIDTQLLFAWIHLLALTFDMLKIFKSYHFQNDSILRKFLETQPSVYAYENTIEVDVDIMLDVGHKNLKKYWMMDIDFLINLKPTHLI